VAASLSRGALYVLETLESPWFTFMPNYIVSTTEEDHGVSPDDGQLPVYTLIVDKFECRTTDATIQPLIIEPVDGTAVDQLDPAAPLPGVATTSHLDGVHSSHV
jgi:hypothetical protein